MSLNIRAYQYIRLVRVGTLRCLYLLSFRAQLPVNAIYIMQSNTFYTYPHMSSANTVGPYCIIRGGRQLLLRCTLFFIISVNAANV